MKRIVFAFTTFLLVVPCTAQPIPLVTINDAGIQSSGVNGITVFDANESVQTSMSGGSNIRRGSFVFDLSSVPSGTTVSSAALRFVTTNLISNTAATATVEFHGFASDNIIDDDDFDNPVSTSGTLLANPTYATNLNGPDEGSPLTISLAGGSDFFSVRSETFNFATFLVASLENTQDRAAAELIINYELACDLDADQSCGTADVDLLVAALAAGSTDLQFDIDDSGIVDSDDLGEWLRVAGEENLPVRRPYLYGDADLSGTVDGADFVAWNANKFTNTASWTGGDFNADGSVNGGDFILWNAHKFASADAVAVPEPHGWLVWLALFASVCVRQR
jgi:hypothetical protein